MRSMAIRALPAMVALVLAGCGAGGGAGAKSDMITRNAGLARAVLRPVLGGDGIAGVRFGQPPAVVAARLGRLFGPPVGADQIPHGYIHAPCGFYWEMWAGLGASSVGWFFVAQLTAWFRGARFVGYDYSPNNFQTRLNTWTQYARHPMMLATARRLAVGDSLARGQRLYGRALVLTSQMQGTPPDPRLIRLPVWEASTASGRIGGGIGVTNLVDRAGGASRWAVGHNSIVGIGAGAAPNTPCSPSRPVGRAGSSPVTYASTDSGSGRTITVSAISMISSAGRPARDACSRIFSGLDAW